MLDQIYSAHKIGRALQQHIPLKLLSLVLGFAFQIVLVKNLQPTDFAAYAVLLAVVMIAQMLLSFGISKTISRFVPDFTVNQDFAGLGLLIRRVILIRLSSLLLLAVALIAGQRVLQLVVPVHLEPVTVVALAVWLAAYIALADAEAFAQSWTAHSASAVVGILEMVGRIGVVWLLIHEHALGIDTLMIGMAATCTTAVMLMAIRLFGLVRRLRLSGPPKATVDDRTALNIKQIPLFALVNYVSLVSWGISSPPIVRVVAAAGLQIIQLAVFSFAQGLVTSIQRALPGLLLLSSIEPLLNAKFASAGRNDRVISALSLIFKLDLVCILALLIFTLVAGDDILRILTKPEYARYYFVLPALVVLLELNTIYSVIEIIANVHLRHRIFGLLWPIGLVAIALMYFTVSRWGLWSALLWPIVDGICKIGVLLFFFRHEGWWRVLDPTRSGLLTLVAALIIVSSIWAQSVVGQPSSTFNLILAVGGVIALCVSLFIVRPLRPIEYDAASTMIPQSWRLPKSLLSQIVWP